MACTCSCAVTHGRRDHSWRDDPRIGRSGDQECLGLESPNQLGNRLVSEPVTTIGGVALEAGTYLTLCIGAANRDPQEFAAPGSLRHHRKPNRHLAFAAGAHACVGMGGGRAWRHRWHCSERCKSCPGCACGAGAARRARRASRGFMIPCPAEIA